MQPKNKKQKQKQKQKQTNKQTNKKPDSETGDDLEDHHFSFFFFSCSCIELVSLSALVAVACFVTGMLLLVA